MTSYHVRYRFRSDMIVHERVFDSAMTRALFIISISSTADILGEWLE